MYNVNWDIIEKTFSFSSPVAITIEDVAIESVNLTKLNEEFIAFIATKALKLLKAYKRDLVGVEEVVDYISSMVNEYDTNIYCNDKGSDFCEQMMGYCSLLLICCQTEIDLKDEIYKNFFKKYEGVILNG